MLGIIFKELVLRRYIRKVLFTEVESIFRERIKGKQPFEQTMFKFFYRIQCRFPAKVSRRSKCSRSCDWILKRRCRVISGFWIGTRFLMSSRTRPKFAETCIWPWLVYPRSFVQNSLVDIGRLTSQGRRSLRRLGIRWKGLRQNGGCDLKVFVVLKGCL